VHEEEVLYEALRSPLGLVIRGSKQRLAKAKSHLAQTDAAISELLLIGPDPAGQLYVLRADRARDHAQTDKATA
jgi:hypothetical protein